jgi:hypothetical protein
MNEVLAQESSMGQIQAALGIYLNSSSELDVSSASLVGQSLAPLALASQALASSINYSADLSSTMNGSFLSLTSQLSEMESSISNFSSYTIDPLKAQSSQEITSSLQGVGTSLSETQSMIAVAFTSSSSLLDTAATLSSSLSGLWGVRSSYAESLSVLESEMQLVSSSVTPMQEDYASLFARSSSLALQLASMSSGMLYLSSEAQRLEAALSSAMSEVSSSWSSSSSSGGASAATSDLSDFDVRNGIKIDLSTNGLIAVTREIANNRLAELAGVQERIAIAAKGVQAVQQVTARATTVIDTMSRLREQRPTTTDITSFSQAIQRRGGISPNVDFGTMTSYRPQTLLGVFKPTISSTRRR